MPQNRSKRMEYNRWIVQLFLIILLANRLNCGKVKRCDDCVNFSKQLDTLTSNNDTQAGTNKTVALDWSEVEKNFTKTLPEDDVFLKWDHMDSNLQTGMRDLLRAIFPKVVAMSTDAKVSGNCSAGILKWIVGLRHTKIWAMKMLDAIGKPTSGILEGSVTMFGNYDQCLKVRVHHDDEESSIDQDYNSDELPQPKEFFRGQYCVTEFKPWLPDKPHFYGMNTIIKTPTNYGEDSAFTEFTKMSTFFHFLSFRMDLCLPSTCSKDDIQQIGNLVAQFAHVRAKVLRCEIHSDDNNLSLGNKVILAAVVLFTLFIISSTIISNYFIPKSSNLLLKLIANFSLINTARIFFNESKHSSLSKLHLTPVYGIRVLVMLWFITVYSMIVVDYQFFREMQTLKDFASRFATQFLTNSMFIYDIFILITAFIYGYSNIENPLKSLAKYLVKRLLKISALMIALTILTCLLVFIVPNGPIKEDFLDGQVNACQTDGWKNLFYLQNFYKNDCLPQTWLFAVEFQLMILVIPLFFVFQYSQKNSTLRQLFWLGLPAVMIAGFVYNYYQIYSNHYPPSYYWTLPDKQQREDYNYNYFFKPWSHLSVFIIGFYAGIYRRIATATDKWLSSSWSFVLFGNSISMAVFAVYIYGFHDWILNGLPDATTSALYGSTMNIFGSLSITWLLYTSTGDMKVCRRSRSNMIKILSSNHFQHLSQLTTCSYLCVPLIQTILLASQQQHLYSSLLLMVYVLLGNTILIYSLALLLSLTIEIPTSHTFQSILNVIFSSNRQSSSSSSQQQQQQQPSSTSPAATRNSRDSRHQDKTSTQIISLDTVQASNQQSYPPDIELPICKSKL